MTKHLTRRATVKDAALIKHGFELAGAGMAEYFWTQSRHPGQSMEDVALERMRRKIQDPDNNIRVSEDGLGAILSYDIPDQPEPLDDVPSIVRPLVSLENQALGTHYINMLAVLPEARRKGLARALIDTARQAAGDKPLSLTVDDTNHKARALYASEGFSEVGRARQVSDGWQATGEHYILMVTGI